MTEYRPYGRFAVPRTMILEQPEKVMKIMGRCIISDVQHMFSYDRILYFAESPLFAETELYHDPPMYYLGVDENGEVVCQDSPFEYLSDFTIARCDFSGRTDNLFPYTFKDGEFRYRVYDMVNEDERGEKFQNCQTGEIVVIGREKGNGLIFVVDEPTPIPDELWGQE